MSSVRFVSNTANGVLSVVQTVNPNLTNLAVSVSGGALQLAWPADHGGWRLQSQTNPLAAGLGTNWFDVARSTTTNQRSRRRMRLRLRQQL